MQSSLDRMTRVRVLTTVLNWLIFLFVAIWLVQVALWLVPFLFQGGFESGAWLDDGATGFGLPKTIIATFWIVIVSLSLAAAFGAHRLFSAFRKGAFFAVETCHQLQVVGAYLIGLMAVDTVYTAAWPAIITMPNPADGATGQRGFAYYFDAGDITVALCGLCFFVIGWVLAEGAAIDAENKAII